VGQSKELTNEVKRLLEARDEARARLDRAYDLGLASIAQANHERDEARAFARECWTGWRSTAEEAGWGGLDEWKETDVLLHPWLEEEAE
jgi:hypothetical protein